MTSLRKSKKPPSLKKRLREAERRNRCLRSFTLVGSLCDIVVKLPQEQSIEVRAFCYQMESNPVRPGTPIKLTFNHVPTFPRM